MRLAGIALALIALLALPGRAFQVEDHIVYPGAPGSTVLRVISTADRAAFEPIIQAFQAAHPDVTVAYAITGTVELMRALHQERQGFDLAISSAMDLQTKLANDGFARSYRPAFADALPDWAIWRNQLFAFTQEPAVLVLSASAFADLPLPATREDLIELLRAHPDRFDGRIGTYDVRQSGFGYLMATQDSRQSDSFWRLIEVIGRLNAQLYCCSEDMIRDVASGKLAVAYNVLGSYATRQVGTTEGLLIVQPADYVNVMLRTALIPETATNVDDAQAMVDFLLRLNTRPDLVAATGLPPLDEPALRADNALRPIRFGPGLLVFLDRLKRQTFLRSWESSITQN